MNANRSVLYPIGFIAVSERMHNWLMPKPAQKTVPKKAALKKQAPEPTVKQASRRKPADHWDLEARRVLKMEMLRANVDAAGLAERISAIDESVASETALALRISRGTFTFGFALLALKALGVDKLDIAFVKTRAEVGG